MAEEKNSLLYAVSTEFTWWKPSGGFEWGRLSFPSAGGPRMSEILANPSVRDDPRNNWLLLPENGDEAISHSPLADSPGLHRKFAELGESRESILQFANAYGPLFDDEAPDAGGASQLPIPHFDVRPHRDSGISLFQFFAECQQQWINEIWDMQDCIELWERLEAGDSKLPTLHGSVLWRKSGVYFLTRRHQHAAQSLLSEEDRKAGRKRLDWFPEFDPMAHIATRDRDNARLEEWGPRFEVANPARQYLTLAVNWKLRCHVSPALRLASPGEGQLEMQMPFVPHNLLGAMWLGLFMEIAGITKLRECLVCGTWFDASDVPQRVYCTSRGEGCRKKAARIRAEVKAGGLPHEVARKYKIPMKRLQDLLSRGRSNEGPVSL